MSNRTLCHICQQQFILKRMRYCNAVGQYLCRACCAKKRGFDFCDLKCSYFHFPIPSRYPLASSIIGIGRNGEVSGTTEEFLPIAFDYVSCTVKNVNIDCVDLHTIKLNISYLLQGPEIIAKRLYALEGWKTIHLEEFLKISGVHQPLAPTFVIFLPKHLMVNSNSIVLKVGGQEEDCLVNQTSDFIALPDCYPPLIINNPTDPIYSYYVGKSTVIYTPFKFGKIYNLTLACESSEFFSYYFGLLFPFREVEVLFNSLHSSHMFPVVKSETNIYQPIRSNHYPPKLEYNWHREDNPTPLPPKVDYALPYRDCPLEAKKTNLTNVNFPLKLSNYELIHHKFVLDSKLDSSLYCKVRVTDSPIPVRIYEQIQSLPSYKDFLVYFDLSNFGGQPITVEVISEISGITEQAIERFTIPHPGSGQAARVGVSQCPRIKWGTLETIYKSELVTLKYTISKIDGEKSTLLYQGTKSIKLLPKDYMVWSISDPKGLTRHNTADLIAAWVCPTDRDGLLDMLRGKAKKYHPFGVLLGDQGNTSLEEMTAQVKALYECITNETRIRYVNQPFVFDFGAGGQRVLTPDAVIKTEGGNCIDLTVLFASLMEGLGLNPLIMLTANHAFLGWGNSENPSKMDFLECTCVGVKPFETAQELGRKAFKEHFFLIGSDELFSNNLLLRTKNSQIVDIAKARNSGIFSRVILKA